MSGHGHVNPRADGVLARCGGPGICTVCALEAMQWAKEHGKPWDNGKGLSIDADGTSRLYAFPALSPPDYLPERSAHREAYAFVAGFLGAYLKDLNPTPPIKTPSLRAQLERIRDAMLRASEVQD